MLRTKRWTILAGFSALALGIDTAGQDARLSASGKMPTFGRIVRTYDFEEAEQAPYVMPINFYRHQAPQQGFPLFGRMQLTRDVAHGGNCIRPNRPDL